MSNLPPKNIAMQHPLSGSSFVNLMRLLLDNPIAEPSYRQKAFQIALLSLSGQPLSFVERLIFGNRIEQTEIVKPPIFILGHWRSGTTYLHRLMIQDRNCGYVSSLQVFLPQSFLLAAKFGKAKLYRAWPKTRDMDNVSYSPDVPEEEEYALGNILPLSFYHCWYFPQNMRQIFDRSVLMELSPTELERWKKTFIQILKKATFVSGNKQLIVKNPANTARIKLLLSLFPNAKFIHIYRNPYDVFASTQNFYDKLLPKYSLQKIDRSKVTKSIFYMYRQTMEKYNAEKGSIPPNNLIEFRYEDFEKNELSYLKHFYEKFELPNFELASVNMQKYIDSQINYKKNDYALSEEIKQKIAHHWDFAIEQWLAAEKTLT